MNIYAILTACACVLECVFLLPFIKTMWPNKNNKSLIFKMLCATMFTAAGVFAMLSAQNISSYAVIVIAGLVFSWFGDLFLHLRGKQLLFVIGGAFFLLAHISYILAYINAVRIYDADKGKFLWYEILTAAVMVIAFDLYNRLIHVDLGKMKIPALIYGYALSFMFVKSVTLCVTAVKSGEVMGGIIICAGALLFLMSDFTLAYTLCDERKKHNYPYKIFNTVTYFAAQMLIALSVLFIGV